MTTIFEVTSIADGSNHGCSSLGSHTPDLSDSLAGLVGFEDGINLLVEEAYARIDLKHKVIEARDDLSR